MVYAAFEGGPCFGIVADNTQRIYITCRGNKKQGKALNFKGLRVKKDNDTEKENYLTTYNLDSQKTATFRQLQHNVKKT